MNYNRDGTWDIDLFQINQRNFRSYVIIINFHVMHRRISLAPEKYGSGVAEQLNYGQRLVNVVKNLENDAAKHSTA